MNSIISILSQYSGLSEKDVKIIISSAPSRYKTYYIPKRNGEKREISQPAKELKSLQKILIKNILSNLDVHKSASAYTKGRSIKYNAEIHKNNDCILKLDFKNFFPSITSRDWENYCRKKKIFSSEEDIAITSNIFFRKNKNGKILRLAIGAPSSPILSNILMHEFDEKAEAIAKKHKSSYSRYADDLTFSALRAGNLRTIKSEIKSLIKSIETPTLHLNEEKTVLATKKYKKFITGLIITDDHKVSIGREKKRLLRSKLHHFINGKLNHEEINKLNGLLSYVNSVEKEFIENIKEIYYKKYNVDIIKEIDIINKTTNNS